MSDEQPTTEELAALMRSTFQAIEESRHGTNGAEPDPVDPDSIIFEPLREFLKRDLPPSVSLVGVPRGGTNLLPQYGWVMPWGREGSGKTSVLVDLLFHAVAGLEWLGYPIDRPLRIVAVVNEGVPGGFQDKLAQKVELWEEPDAVLDNLAIYASPWGRFTFRDERIAAHARDYCRDFGADYFALDPLHTLGTVGAGTPQETEAFKQVLQDFGVWEWIGALTAHHANKNGMVSGDWGRHPDTVVHLEKDGKNPATRWTVEKARPVDPGEHHVPFIFEWLTESIGYRRRSIELTATLPDSELIDAIKAALEQYGPLNKGELERLADAPDKQIRAGLEKALKAGIVVIHRQGAAHVVHLAETFAEDEAQTRLDTDVELGTEPLPSLPRSQQRPESRPLGNSARPPKGGAGVAEVKDGAEPVDNPTSPEPVDNSDEPAGWWDE